MGEWPDLAGPSHSKASLKRSCIRHGLARSFLLRVLVDLRGGDALTPRQGLNVHELGVVLTTASPIPVKMSQSALYGYQPTMAEIVAWVSRAAA
ncbi:hypothetical protein BH20PSE1_BH20PSE1_25720 [soil metagenome]